MQLRLRFNGQSLVVNLFKFIYPKSLAKYELSDQIFITKDVIAELSDQIFITKAVIAAYPDEIWKPNRSHLQRNSRKKLQTKSVNCKFDPGEESEVILSRSIKITNSVCNNSSYGSTAERSFSKLKLIKTYLRFFFLIPFQIKSYS